eukprot:5439035-Amphidinium_carterae.1
MGLCTQQKHHSLASVVYNSQFASPPPPLRHMKCVWIRWLSLDPSQAHYVQILTKICGLLREHSFVPTKLFNCFNQKARKGIVHKAF